jgi:DNA-binding NtrC family response regulator
LLVELQGVCMSERVLIIDDEENIRQMLRLTLETAD